MQIRYLKAIWESIYESLCWWIYASSCKEHCMGMASMATLADEMGESSAQAIEKREIHL